MHSITGRCTARLSEDSAAHEVLGNTWRNTLVSCILKPTQEDQQDASKAKRLTAIMRSFCGLTIGPTTRCANVVPSHIPNNQVAVQQRSSHSK